MNAKITRREAEVIKWLAKGKTADATAQILGISAKTVESHRSNIYAKLDVSSKAQLVEMAIGLGIIPLLGRSTADHNGKPRNRFNEGLEGLRSTTLASLADNRAATIIYLKSEIIATRAKCDAYKAEAANLEALLLEAKAA